MKGWILLAVLLLLNVGAVSAAPKAKLKPKAKHQQTIDVFMGSESDYLKSKIAQLREENEGLRRENDRLLELGQEAKRLASDSIDKLERIQSENRRLHQAITDVMAQINTDLLALRQLTAKDSHTRSVKESELMSAMFESIVARQSIVIQLLADLNSQPVREMDHRLISPSPEERNYNEEVIPPGIIVPRLPRPLPPPKRLPSAPGCLPTGDVNVDVSVTQDANSNSNVPFDPTVGAVGSNHDLPLARPSGKNVAPALPETNTVTTGDIKTVSVLPYASTAVTSVPSKHPNPKKAKALHRH